MKSKQLSAKLLTPILSVVLLLGVGAIAGGFYFAQDKLRDFAHETGKLNSEAATQQENITSLQKLKKKLAELTPIQEKARKISAESKQYQYQNEIVNDITAIAARSGVTITGYTFTDTAAVGGAAAQATTTPAPASGSPAATTPTQEGQSQLKSKTVTVNFMSPISYSKLLNFIYLIEQNATKMQIATINLTKGDNADEVTAQSFQIEVYVK